MKATELQAGEVKITQRIDKARKSEELVITEKAAAEYYTQVLNGSQTVEWSKKGEVEFVTVNQVILQRGKTQNGRNIFPLAYKSAPVLMVIDNNGKLLNTKVTNTDKNGFNFPLNNCTFFAIGM